MFEKSKSEITFKDFKNKLNIATDFENDWGHFYDPDDNNINNINNNVKFHNKLYQPIKKRIEIPEKIKEIKRIEIPEKRIEIPETIKEIEEMENDDVKKYIIDTVFSCISVAFITFVSFKVHHFTSII
jgi:hypothetical protein